jgi:serine/threonine protein kinase
MKSPTQIGSTTIRRVSYHELINAIADVAETLQVLHDKEIVHGDVKPANILTSFNPQGRLVGWLTDYGYSGWSDIRNVSSNNYPYWSPCAREGIMTFTNDCYGLAVSTLQMISPESWEHINSWVNNNSPEAAKLHFLKSFKEFRGKQGELEPDLEGLKSNMKMAEKIWDIAFPVIKKIDRFDRENYKELLFLMKSNMFEVSLLAKKYTECGIPSAKEIAQQLRGALEK